MKILTLLTLALFTMPTFANDHLITLESNHTAKETANRFTTAVTDKGLTLFARIDHSANAAGVNLELNPTELILFGNPNAGTLLMQCAPTVAIDLPQKALVWQDADDKVWLAYPDPMYLKELHSIEGCDPVLGKISGLLAKLAASATQ